MKGATSSAWFVTNTGAEGYVFNRALWRVPAGHYKVSVTLSASALTNVEVWDTTQSRLLKRIVVSATHGKTSLNLPVVDDSYQDTNRMSVARCSGATSR